MKRLPLNQGKIPEVVLLDDDDFERFSKFNWTRRRANRQCYAFRKNSEGKIIHLHREILGLKTGDGKIVDHANGNGLDNRKCNLRICNHSQNNQNKLPDKGLPRKGVRKSKCNTWEARITIGGVTRSIGSFRTEFEAVLAYDEAAVNLFGEYARTNFMEHKK